MGFYRRFIRNYAAIAGPLTDLLKIEAFCWNENADDASELYSQLRVFYAEHPVGRPKELQWLILPWPSPASERASSTFKTACSIRWSLNCSLTYSANFIFRLWAVTQETRQPCRASWLYSTSPKWPQMSRTSLPNARPVANASIPLNRHMASSSHYPCLVKFGMRFPWILSPTLPPSVGKTVIWVVVDRLTKFAHFVALSGGFSAASLAATFLLDIYRLHGAPSVIISDRDPIFLSRF
ncbi:hypothetical protein Salat_1167800 [Sesamum alatum]|uniref:Integrase catalytic domain-containing protein n=1 Tax=Sesamum alatum TaxID=300844 RepID=A0AAE1YEB0_9LAMI|nr:hypothetical protein Salat_1167800 [Sesamum alatum]